MVDLDTVTARVTLKELKGRRATFETVCTVGDAIVVDGEAVIFVPSRTPPQ